MMPSVLVIDPFADECELYAVSLRASGFEARCVESSAAALKIAASARPQAVVVRLRQLRKPDGIELTRRLKRHACTQDMPVVIIPASIRQQDRVDAMQAGCDRYLLLPCSPGDLINEIRCVSAVCDKASRRRASPRRRPRGDRRATQDADT